MAHTSSVISRHGRIRFNLPHPEGEEEDHGDSISTRLSRQAEEQGRVSEAVTYHSDAFLQEFTAKVAGGHGLSRSGRDGGSLLDTFSDDGSSQPAIGLSLGSWKISVECITK
jgi:hypothetical protein